MDLSKYRNKLIGSEDERAVSPVIGVILMVAITVILAAVIAAFVLDMGSGLGSNANAGIDTSVDSNDNNIEFSVTDMGNAEEIILRGDVEAENGSDYEITGGPADGETTYSEDTHALTEVGETLTLDFPTDASNSGTVTIVAVMEDGSETQIGEEDYDFESE